MERLVPPNFITEIIEEDLRLGRYSKIVTRFPPEPNGYAHLGHAIASFIDFGIAIDYNGECRLRFDDTNPETEREEYVEAIIEDMRWLGWDWGERPSFASDYFDELYAMAIRLIQKGLAYVDSTPPELMARLRGTVETPGTPTPDRERPIEENLELFERMRKGEFGNGAYVLRAKISLDSPNMKLRDPVLYRIVHAHHYRTKDRWCIYPSYDFAQPLTDALDGVTHSLCSLEFVDNRAVYDWLLDQLWEGPIRPHQYEFGRRSLEYTVVSKRKLRRLVEQGWVAGWDDPRMPTLAGVRRRGTPPSAVRRFAASVGISRTNRTVDLGLFEHAVREELNLQAPRVLAVTQPLKVILINLEEELTLQLPYWPPDVIALSPDGRVTLPNGERVPPEAALRPVPLTRELYIEAEDFSLNPPKGFKRLVEGGTVRLRGAGVIRCEEVRRSDRGVEELYCRLLPEGSKAQGVIHWVSATHGLPAEFRLYDRLFRVPEPEREEEGWMDALNPESLIIRHGYVEPNIAHDPPNTRYQFERLGYFWQDPLESRPDRLIFNRIIALKDSWKGGR